MFKQQKMTTFFMLLTLLSCSRFYYKETKGVIYKIAPAEFHFMGVREFKKENYNENEAQKMIPEAVYFLFDEEDRTIRKINILNGNVNVKKLSYDSLGNDNKEIYKLSNIIKENHYYTFYFKGRVPFVNYLTVFVDSNRTLHKVELKR